MNIANMTRDQLKSRLQKATTAREVRILKREWKRRNQLSAQTRTYQELN